MTDALREILQDAWYSDEEIESAKKWLWLTKLPSIRERYDWISFTMVEGDVPYGEVPPFDLERDWANPTATLKRDIIAIGSRYWSSG
jgi:hypothetical protein